MVRDTVFITCRYIVFLFCIFASILCWQKNKLQIEVTHKKTHSVHSPEGKFYANTRWQTIKLVLDR